MSASGLVLASASWCSNCGPAKTALLQAGVEFDVFDVDGEDAEAQKPKGLRSIPALIQNNEVIAVGTMGINKWIQENK